MPDGWIGGLCVGNRCHVGRLKGAAGASKLSVQYGLFPEEPGNNLQSNVQLACHACYQQFKRNRNCELAADTKPNMISRAST